jgi:hypothetical protein
MHIASRSMPASARVRPGRAIARIAALLLLIGAPMGLTAGCGSAQTFTASEFVHKINEQGVSMRLGQQVQSGGGDQIYSITLSPLAGTPAPEPGHEGAGGASGSLYVYGDTGAAGDRLRACRASAGLLCFQASNVVIVLDEESGPLEAQRLGIAIRRLGD